MEPRVYYNLLHKILYCIKFRNSEKFDEYVEIVYSPLYIELFKQVKSELYKIENIDINTLEKKKLTDYPDEYSRVCQLIENSDYSVDLSDELKRKLLEIIIYPFQIGNKEEEILLNLFK